MNAGLNLSSIDLSFMNDKATGICMTPVMIYIGSSTPPAFLFDLVNSKYPSCRTKKSILYLYLY